MVKPRGTDATHRIADFTCRGEEIDLIGPGAGVVSLFPKGKRSVMSGTSMATPVVTGRIAKALAQNMPLLGGARDQRRSDAINKMALKAAQNLGFSATFQGQGLPE
jgi:subtilisin